MKPEEVSVVSCEYYDRERVERAVRRIFELHGGVGALVPSSGSVFVKVNALVGLPPEKGVTTHPEVVGAVVRELSKVTENITIGDSPGGPFSPPFLKRVYEKTGLDRVADETGARLNLDTSVSEVKVPTGRKLRSITVAKAMVERDALISVSKFKTHELTGITAAIKNLYGAVPGMTKITYHSRFNDAREFSELLVDVALACKPVFNIVDGVVSMDGDGPRKGELKNTGFLAGGTDVFAVDAALMRLIGKDLEMNTALAAAIRRGLASPDTKGVMIIGDDFDRLVIRDFRLPHGKLESSRVPDLLMRRFGKHMSARPIIEADKCDGCAKCVEICPANACSLESGKAVIDLRKCLRCYCCYELCETGGVGLTRPALLRLARRLGF